MAKMAALTGKCHQYFMTAIVTPDTGKTVLQTTTIEIAKNGQPDLRSQIPRTGFIPLLVYPLQFLVKVLNTAVIVG